MYRVVKRDGKIKDFDISKIISAIVRAFEAKQKDYIAFYMCFMLDYTLKTTFMRR